MTGKELGKYLETMTSSTSPWVNGDVYTFTLNSTPIFTLNIKNKSDFQIRNAEIKFTKSPLSKWEDVLPCMVKGFAAIYMNYFEKKFIATKADPQNHWFVAFVLIQFELARRVPREDKSIILSRDQTEEGIKVALQCDTKWAYETLTTMFGRNGTNFEERREAYKDLIRSETLPMKWNFQWFAFFSFIFVQ